MWWLGPPPDHVEPADGTMTCQPEDVQGHPFYPWTTVLSPAAHLHPPSTQGGAPLPAAGYEESTEMLQGA